MKSNALNLLAKLAKITIRNPSDLRHVIGVANWAASEIVNPDGDTRDIPQISVLDICPGTQRWILQAFPSVGASV